MTATTHRSISTFYRYYNAQDRSSEADIDAARGAAAAAATARARLVISVVALSTVLIGLIGLCTDVEALQAIGLCSYLLFGVGAAPWVFFRELALPARLVLSAATSVSVLLFVSTAMLLTGAWHPIATGIVALLATIGIHVGGIYLAFYDAAALRQTDTPALPPTETPALGPPALRNGGTPVSSLRLQRLPPTPYLLAGVGAAICLLAALAHRHLDAGEWGFLPRIGPLWYLGLALILASLVVARTGEERFLAVGVILLLLVLTGTPALVYDGPRSPSAAKHVELVEQIRQLHYLHSSVAIYNGWPSYFTAMAWLSDVAGLRDSIELALAWPALIGSYKLIALRYFAGRVLTDRRQIWLAVGFALLADTIGQDYFAPQSLAFVLAIMIFGLAWSSNGLRRRHQVIGLTVLGVDVSLTHQLTPYLVGGALCVLVVVRQLRPWWLPVTVLGPALCWAAVNWGAISGFLNLGAVGSAANFKPPAPGTTAGLQRSAEFVSFAGGLIAGVLALAVLAGFVLVRRRRDRTTWALALCPGVGVAIIAIHPYGKEGIFRAALFALPWLAVLAAQVFQRADTRMGLYAPAAVLSALTVTFLLGTFSLDASNVLRTSDREAFQLFASTPTNGGLNYALILGPGDLPSAPTTTPITHRSIDRPQIDPAGFALTQAIDQSTVLRLTSELISYRGTDSPEGHLFAVWSPTSSYYGTEYGLHKPAQFAALRTAFQRSKSWTTIYQSHGTILFEYVGAA